MRDVVPAVWTTVWREIEGVGENKRESVKERVREGRLEGESMENEPKTSENTVYRRSAKSVT